MYVSIYRVPTRIADDLKWEIINLGVGYAVKMVSSPIPWYGIVR